MERSTPEYAALFRQYLNRDPTLDDQEKVAEALGSRSDHMSKQAMLEATNENSKLDFNARVASVLDVEGLTKKDLEDVLKEMQPQATTSRTGAIVRYSIAALVGLAFAAGVNEGVPILEKWYHAAPPAPSPATICVSYDEPNWPPAQSSSHFEDHVTPKELSELVEKSQKNYIHNFKICD